MEGWSREEGPRVNTHQPLSPAVLKVVFEAWGSVCSFPYEIALFHVASLIAFFGALRVGELMASSKKHGSRRALTLEDVQILSNSLEVRIRTLKTDQKGKGKIFSLAVCDDGELCPVAAMVRYLAVRGPSKGYLFCHADTSPLTRYQFWLVSGKAWVKLGLSGVQFGINSFRIGAASTVAAMGYTPEQIQGIGC